MTTPGGGYALAEAFVSIRPDTRGFREETLAGVETSLTGISPTIRVGADTANARTAVTSLRAYIDVLASRLTSLRLTADDKQVQATLARLYGQLLAINQVTIDPDIDAAGLARAQATALALDGTLDSIAGKVAAAGVRLDGYDSARAQLAALQVALTDLSGRAAGLNLDLHGDAAIAEVTRLRAAITELYAQLGQVQIPTGPYRDPATGQFAVRTTTPELTAAAQAVRDLTAAYEGLRAEQLNLASDEQAGQLREMIAVLAGRIEPLRITADDSDLQAKLARAAAQLAALSRLSADPDLTIEGADKALAQLLGIYATVEDLAGKVVEAGVDLNTGDDMTRLAALQSMLEALAGMAEHIDVNVDDAAAIAQLAALRESADFTREALANLAAAGAAGGDIGPDLGPLIAQVAALHAGLDALSGGGAGGGDGGGFEGVARSSGDAGRGLGYFGRLIAGNIGGVAFWHVALDFAIESLISLTLASAAAAAGVAILAQPVDELHDRLVSMYTVSQALGQNVLPGLTGQFHQLSEAAAPSAIELFGGALNLASGQAGQFATTAREVVNLFDDWVAKLNLWMGAQGGMQDLLQTGVGYLTQFAHLGMTLLQVLGNLLSADPGLARFWLDLFQGAADVLKIFSELPAPIIQATLLLHGFYLLGNVLLGTFGRLIGMVPGLSAVSAVLSRGFHLGDLLTVPGILVAVGAALAYVAYEGTQADADTTKFIAHMNAQLSQMSASQALTQINLDIGQLDQKIQSAFSPQNLNRINDQITSIGHVGQGLGDYFGAIGGSWNKLVSDITSGHYRSQVTDVGNMFRSVFGGAAADARQASNDVAAYQGQIVKLTAEQHNLFKVMGDLTRGTTGFAAGTYTAQQALALMDLAGVKATDHFAIMMQKVHDLLTGWQAIGVQGPILANAVNAVTFQTEMQDSQVTKLTQAWTGFFNLVASGEQGLVGFAQSIEQMNTLAASGGLSATSLASANSSVASATAALAGVGRAGSSSAPATATQLTAANARLSAATQRVTADTIRLSNAQAALASLQNSGRASAAQLAAAQTAVASANATLASAHASVATAQNSLNSLQQRGSNLANTQAAAADRLTSAQTRLNSVTGTGAGTFGQLNTGGLALTNSFLQSASAAQTEANNLMTLSAAAGLGGKGTALVTQGIKDMISQLLPAAQHSKTLTTILYALAQQGGFQGADSFKELSKWVGNTRDPMKNLDGIVQTLTVHAGNLAADVQTLATGIDTKLNQAIEAAVIQAHGGQQVFDDFANAIVRSHGNINQLLPSAQKLAEEIYLDLGKNTQQTKGEFEAFAIQMGLSRQAADHLWNEIVGKLSPSLQDQADKILPGATKMFETFAEVGLNETKGQADDLWKEILNKLGPELGALGDLASGPAKQKFIDWAENGLHKSKNEAYDLWNELVTLQSKINALHGKTVGVNFVGSGTGSIAYKESIPGVTLGPSSSGILGFHAAGGLISMGSGPTADDVPAMLSRGEYVQQAAAVDKYGVAAMEAVNQGKAVIAYAGGGPVPRFAGGGWITSSFTGLDGPAGTLTAGQPFMEKAEAAFGRAVEAAFAKAVIAKFKKDMSALAGSGPAIVAYARSFLGKIPYVFGGNSLSGGIDCSGFTQQIYGHFGIHAPRTSEAQYAWVTRSGPVPGSLAFYVSPAGGPPPGHVAIVQDAGSVISQGGGMGPTIERLNFMPLMGTGVPKGGFPTAAGGKGNQAIGGGGPLQAIAMALLRQYGWGNQWNAFNALETREAGWSMTARNPSSGAYGLAQFIDGPYEYYQYGGNPNTALGQLTAMMNYIAQRYPSGPNQAWAHELSAGWYSRGGPVKTMDAGGWLPPGISVVRNDTGGPEYLQRVPGPGFASGGSVTSFRSTLAGEQNLIERFYNQVAAAIHNRNLTTRTRDELGTLSRRESAEVAAYRAATSQMTSAALSHLGATAREEKDTAYDQGLQQLPGIGSLQYRLGQLLSTLNHPPPAGGGSSGGGGIPQPPPSYPANMTAWTNQLKAYQKNEYNAWWNLDHAFRAGLQRPGPWLKSHATAVTSELQTLRSRQSAEEAAYDNILHHGTSSANRNKFASRLSEVIRSTQDQDLSYAGSGGHPGWDKGLAEWATALRRMAQGPLPSGPEAAQIAWLAQFRDYQKNEYNAWWNLNHQFELGLARPGAWMKIHGAAVRSQLATLKYRQSLEEAAYDNILHHGDSAANLAKLAGRLQLVLNMARTGTLSYTGSGGHPGWDRALQEWSGKLLTMARSPAPYFSGVNQFGMPNNPPWVPGNLGPVHSVGGGVLTFDRGGLLPPGLHMIWNGTGAAETVTPARPAEPQDVHLHLHVHGPVGSQAELEDWFVRTANHTARTGRLGQAVRTASR